jgi:hypothetical protein
MHSTSILSAESFDISVGGRPVSHADFFNDLTRNRRLGLVAPNRVEGAGAAGLLLAYVTAFYDEYRADGGDFYAYPDYFVFQQASPPADYGMCDVSPQHKCVSVGKHADPLLQAITDRGANILIVPDGPGGEHEFEAVALASARRNIDTCYAYSADGEVADPDITVRCTRSPLDEWVQAMFDSIKDDPHAAAQGAAWLKRTRSADVLEQSYRRISLDDALARLASVAQV